MPTSTQMPMLLETPMGVLLGATHMLMPMVNFNRFSMLLMELVSALLTHVFLLLQFLRVLPQLSTLSHLLPTFNPELPVAPVYTGVAPEPVQDTPEVAEAKAAHLALVAAAAAPAERKKREADPAILAGASRIISAPTPLIHNPPVRPIVHHAAYVAPYAGLGYHGLGLGYAGLPYLG